MKKNQKQGIVVALLVLTMATVLGVQAGGNPSSAGRKLQRPSSTYNAVAVSAKVEEPTINRDPFWHPALVEKASNIAASPITPASFGKAPAVPIPPPLKGESYWIPPVIPDITSLQPAGNDGTTPESAVAKQPKVEEPKKVLRVCGFLATQTPKIILSMNGEEPTTCGEGEKPWPGVTIFKIGIDSATLKWGNRLFTVVAGQEVEK